MRYKEKKYPHKRVVPIPAYAARPALQNSEWDTRQQKAYLKQREMHAAEKAQYHVMQVNTYMVFMANKTMGVVNDTTGLPCVISKLIVDYTASTHNMTYTKIKNDIVKDDTGLPLDVCSLILEY